MNSIQIIHLCDGDAQINPSTEEILHTTTTTTTTTVVHTNILQMKISKNQAAKQTTATAANQRNKRKIRHPNNLMEIYAYRYLLWRKWFASKHTWMSFWFLVREHALTLSFSIFCAVLPFLAPILPCAGDILRHMTAFARRCCIF